MTKALLINTATDLAGGDNGKGATIAGGPNADQGWGRVNLGSTFDSTTRQLYDQRPGDVLTTPGPDRGARLRRGRREQAGEGHARVDRPARPPLTGNAFVNNLDLEVAAGGQTYRGNVFGGRYSRTRRRADPRNNVESVYLPAGTSGRCSVTVRATTLGGDGAARQRRLGRPGLRARRLERRRAGRSGAGAPGHDDR